MIILPLILLVCALSASNSFLYFKWVGSVNQITELKLNIQLIQNQLDQQLVLIESLKTTVQPSVGHAVKHSASLDYTHLLGLVGIVSIIVVLFLVFPNNRSGDPVIDLAREMTSQNENLSRGIVEQSLLESKLITDHFEILLERVSAQNQILTRLIEDQTVIGQRIVTGNSEIIDVLGKFHLNENYIFGVLCSKLDVIDSMLRQQHPPAAVLQSTLDIIKNFQL